MAIGIDYFQAETPQQATPVLNGMGAAQQMLTNALQQQAQGIQNQYLPQGLQSQIGLTNAQAYLANQQGQYYPFTARAQMMNGVGRYIQAMTAINNSFRQGTQTPPGEYLLAHNKAYANAYNNMLQNQANIVNGGYGMDNMMNTAFPGMGAPMQSPPGGAPVVNASSTGTVPTPNLMPPANQAQQNGATASALQTGLVNQQQVQQLQNLYGQQAPNTNQAAPSNNFTGGIQDAANSALISKTVPKQIQQQRYYDQSAQNLLQQVTPMMPTVSQFASLAGHANMAVDKYAAATGQQTSPGYKAFNNFSTVQMPLISNEMRRALGGQATDSERDAMEAIANPVNWRNNFDLTMSKYNALVNALGANSQALNQNQSQTAASLQQGIANPPLAPTTYRIKSSGGKYQTFSAQDIASTARKYNMTSADVIQHLRQQGALQ